MPTLSRCFCYDLHMLKLLLPILFPSWRFFRCIDPSPRLEYGYCESLKDQPERWYPLEKPLQHFNYVSAIFHLFFNPTWNQQLFMNTCAEHLFEGANERWESFIVRRIMSDKKIVRIAGLLNKNVIQFRIKAIINNDGHITSPILFTSKPFIVDKS